MWVNCCSVRVCVCASECSVSIMCKVHRAQILNTLTLLYISQRARFKATCFCTDGLSAKHSRVSSLSLWRTLFGGFFLSHDCACACGVCALIACVQFQFDWMCEKPRAAGPELIIAVYTHTCIRALVSHSLRVFFVYVCCQCLCCCTRVGSVEKNRNIQCVLPL